MTLKQVKNTFLLYNASLSECFRFPNLRIIQKKNNNYVFYFRTSYPIPTRYLNDVAQVKGMELREDGTYDYEGNNIKGTRFELTPAQTEQWITSHFGYTLTNKNIKICGACARGFGERAHKVGAKTICDRCFRDYYNRCGNCKKWKHRYECSFARLSNDTLWCMPCANKLLFRCGYCSKYAKGKPPYKTRDNDGVCQECFDRNQFVFCETCKNIGQWNDMFYCYAIEKFFCRLDYRTHKCESKHRGSDYYQFVLGKPDSYFNNIQRLVGVEIEAEEGKGVLQGEVAPMTNIGSDGSLSSGGVELRTPPAMGDKIRPIITKTCEGLNKRGFIGTIKAGLHVHIDVNDIKNNNEKLMQIVKTYYSIEDILWSMLPPSRWSSTYAHKLMHTHPYSNIFKKKTTLDEAWQRNGSTPQGHYQGLNLSSMAEGNGRGTIEIRYHSGTTNANKIINWIAINLCLFDYAIKRYKASEIQELVDMPTGSNKFQLFCMRFNIPIEVQNYMLGRIDKFNPNWNVVFNRGAFARSLEIKQREHVEIVMAEEIKKIKTVMKRKIIVQYRKQYKKEWKQYITPTQLESEAISMAKSYVQRQLPVSLIRSTNNNGFLGSDEIRQKVSIYNKITKIGAQGKISGEGDKEFTYI